MAEKDLEAADIERKVHNLAEAMSRVRSAQADREDVVVDMKHAKFSRLELLADDVAPVFDDVPDDNEQFEFAITNGETPRHFGVDLSGDELSLYFTRIGDAPERIFRTTMDLSRKDWQSWETQIHNARDVHQEMLRPVHAWEGGELKAGGSGNGQTGFANALRDPDLFRDRDGRIYLLYVGGGESAIGIARVNVE